MEACNVASAFRSTCIQYIDDVPVICSADGHRALRTCLIGEAQAFLIDAEDGNVIATSIYYDQPAAVFTED